MTQIEVIEGEKHEREFFTLEEDFQIWEFLHRFAYDETEQVAEKFTGPHPNLGRKLWKMFIRETDSRRSVLVLCTRYRKMTKNLQKMPFGTEMKLNLYSLDIPVPKEFTREALRFAKMWLNKEKSIQVKIDNGTDMEDAYNDHANVEWYDRFGVELPIFRSVTLESNGETLTRDQRVGSLFPPHTIHIFENPIENPPPPPVVISSSDDTDSEQEYADGRSSNHFKCVMLPQFDTWPCDFDRRCDLVISLWIPIDLLIKVCDKQKKLRLSESAEVDLRSLIIWKFLFFLLHKSIHPDEAKSRWRAVSEGDGSLESFEESSTKLKDMPIHPEGKHFLMKKFGISGSSEYLSFPTVEVEEAAEEGNVLDSRPFHNRLIVKKEPFWSSEQSEEQIFFSESMDFEVSHDINHNEGPSDPPHTSEALPSSFMARRIKEEHFISDYDDYGREEEVMDDSNFGNDHFEENLDSPNQDDVPDGPLLQNCIKKEVVENHSRRPVGRPRKECPIRVCRIKDQVVPSGNVDSKKEEAPKKRERVTFTRKEVYKMWRFVNKKIRDFSGRPRKNKFESSWADWKEFTRKMGLGRSPSTYKQKFSQVVINYPLKLDSENRLEECDTEKWAEISQSDDEEISSDEEIGDSECDSEDEGHFEPTFTYSETHEMWNFILYIVRKERFKAGKTQKLYLLPDQLDFWLEFDKTVGPDRSLSTLATHFHLNMFRKLSSSRFDVETKANLYYSLNIPVTLDFYNEFKKVATAELEDRDDGIPYIENYYYNDGSVFRESWSDLLLIDEDEAAETVRKSEKI
ncbi:hypothetical protein B9Z55_016457 [Caenorhabditis nigoni]|uniref:SPK domain-containing protein n=1 Tax=Caenorhabditis nigoni TaxID=1611254 RepID=A0A2G5T596_9PELO|nr:hypothetical protein B9Z55_016457 [Caenorhabditis nigoni]